MPAVARLTALLVVTCFGLGGCGGSAEPSPMPTVSTSASSSSTGPAEPELPQAAKADTKAGAVAFVKHYVALINYAQATGDVDELRAASDPECQSCIDIAGSIADLYAAGGQLNGGNRTMLRHQVARGLERWIVLTRIKSTRQEMKKPGDTDRVFPGGEKSEEFQVARREDGWEVVRWTRVD